MLVANRQDDGLRCVRLLGELHGLQWLRMHAWNGSERLSKDRLLSFRSVTRRSLRWLGWQCLLVPGILYRNQPSLPLLLQGQEGGRRGRGRRHGKPLWYGRSRRNASWIWSTWSLWQRWIRTSAWQRWIRTSAWSVLAATWHA